MRGSDAGVRGTVAEQRRTQQGAAVRPYDAAAKHLFERDPAAWLRYVGLDQTGPVAAVDVDLATVLAEADKVVRVGGEAPWLAHFEVQTTYDSTMPARLLRYSALLHHRHALPVASVLMLLRPEADGPALTGTLGLPRGLAIAISHSGTRSCASGNIP